MKSIKTVSIGELIVRLATFGTKGAQPITFTALINAKARKTGNPFGEVFKLSRVNAFTSFDYEGSVNRQQVREGGEGDFAAQARKWGERVGPSLVENKGEFYLVAKVQTTQKPVYLVRRNGFLTPIARELVAPYLPAKRSSAEAQGVEKEIVYRNYALRNLVSLVMGGESLRVRQPHGAPI